MLLEKLAVAVYEKIESSVQKYADIASLLNVLTRLTKAWRNNEYTEVSYVTVFLSVAILLYFVSPIDLVPDFIPIVGGLDDVLLLGFLLKMIDKEIERFLTKKKENNFKNWYSYLLVVFVDIDVDAISLHWCSTIVVYNDSVAAIHFTSFLTVWRAVDQNKFLFAFFWNGTVLNKILFH